MGSVLSSLASTFSLSPFRIRTWPKLLVCPPPCGFGTFFRDSRRSSLRHSSVLTGASRRPQPLALSIFSAFPVLLMTLREERKLFSLSIEFHPLLGQRRRNRAKWNSVDKKRRKGRRFQGNQGFFERKCLLLFLRLGVLSALRLMNLLKELLCYLFTIFVLRQREPINSSLHTSRIRDWKVNERSGVESQSISSSFTIGREASLQALNLWTRHQDITS